ncbi:unnamed protein product [Blepharisma stoltei]|uniref:Synaptobrevin family protein n=1 Tax=Blepharisma stoltei TaxID=1481888 RepID=A0AAU9I502_9CILI|nr:unnamed protein product [Blepharisma stoltei]
MPSSILYVFISSLASSSPILEINPLLRNFQPIIQPILKQLNPNSSISYLYEDSYIFHFHNDANYTFLCITDSLFSKGAALGFLYDLEERFFKWINDKEFESRKSHFEEIIRAQMEYFSITPDKISVLKDKIEKAKEIMSDNIEKVIEKGEKIEILVKKTENICTDAVSLSNKTIKMRRALYWQNFKIIIQIIICVILFMGFPVLLASRGLSFSIFN